MQAAHAPHTLTRMTQGHALLPRTWLRRGWLAWLLWPASLVMRLLVAVRRAAYARGWFASGRVPVPVIVVGNVVAGGAGKTPVVLALVQHLQARGCRWGCCHGVMAAPARRVWRSPHRHHCPTAVTNRPSCTTRQALRFL